MSFGVSFLAFAYLYVHTYVGLSWAAAARRISGRFGGDG